MLIVSKSTANQMIETNTNLKLIEDIYYRTYLVGTGAEILVLEDDSPLIQKINAQRELKQNAS